MLDMSRALKIMKDCEGCIDKKCKPKFVDLVFTKVKARTEKKVDYPRFLDYIFVISCFKILGIDASSKAIDDAILVSPGKPSEMYDEKVNCNVSDVDLSIIKSYKYGRLKGKAALIVAFIEKYLLSNAEFKRLLAGMGQRSSEKLGAKDVSLASTRMYSFISFSLKFRKWQWIHNKKKALELEQYRYDQCTRIQSCMRGRRGRLKAALAAQQVYYKYIDAALGTQYWYNARTGASSWTKPALLLSNDCGFPVQLPADDTLFIVYCSVCEVKTMQCLCDECDESMCNSCFHKIHKAGVRKNHEAIKIPCCVRCEFQIGTKMCDFCQDAYCDTCFDFEHRRASFRTHHYRWITSPCAMCNKRAAQWTTCFAVNDWYEQFLCTVCCRQKHGDPETAEGVSRRRFIGFLAAKRREVKQLQADMKKRAESYRRERTVLDAETQLLSAITIQRLYRGYISRKHHQPFVDERRAYLALKAEIDKKKRELRYRFLDIFGYAPHFATDTVRERFLMLYPRIDRRAVEEAMNHEWDEAERFLNYREKHITEIGALNLSLSCMYQFLLHIAKRRKEYTDWKMNSNQKLLESLKLELRGCTDREEKQALKKKLENTTLIYEALNLQYEAIVSAQVRYEELRQRYGGPRWLYDEVKERRWAGIKVPYQAHMFTGYNTAYITRLPAAPTEEGILESSEEQPLHKHIKFLLRAGDELNLQGRVFRVKSAVHHIEEAALSTLYEVEFVRYWNAPNEDVPVRKLIEKSFYIRPLYIPFRSALASFPAQYTINLAARFTNGVSIKLVQASATFEEDSAPTTWLKDRSLQMLTVRDRVCTYSFQPVDMNPPYSLRNISKTTYSVVMRTGGLLRKLVRVIKQLSKPKSPYYTWKTKPDQMRIKAVFRNDPNTAEVLGEFEMNLLAPCDVCREYVERNFREKLNETIGSSFNFLYNDERGERRLNREREIKTYSKKVIPFLINPSTLVGEYIMTIVPEANADVKIIPPFEVEENMVPEFDLSSVESSVRQPYDDDSAHLVKM